MGVHVTELFQMVLLNCVLGNIFPNMKVYTHCMGRADPQIMLTQMIIIAGTVFYVYIHMAGHKEFL